MNSAFRTPFAAAARWARSGRLAQSDQPRTGNAWLLARMEIVSERFGKSVTFHTCFAIGMDLDELLHFLEARDTVRIKSGVVYPGGSPACEH